jgi:hypothetical protein
MSRRKKNVLIGPFVSHSLKMRVSPAWRHLSDNARRLLSRLEVEHMSHGGARNGNLPCTYSDFERAGLRRASVARAIREAEALGFLEVTERGGRSISEFRRPSTYRLTMCPGAAQAPL